MGSIVFKCLYISTSFLERKEKRKLYMDIYVYTGTDYTYV